MKVNTLQCSNEEFENKLYDFREAVELQLEAEYDGALKFSSTDSNGRLLDGGFLTLKGNPREANINVDEFFAICQYFDITAKSLGFGGAYHLPFVSFKDTGLIIFRVYDR